MSVSSVPTVSSVSLGTTEALIDEVFLFGRVLRDAWCRKATVTSRAH